MPLRISLLLMHNWHLSCNFVELFTHKTHSTMVKKITKLKKRNPEKTTLIKIAEKVGEIAGRIANKKDHMVDMAATAIDSVKTGIQGIGSKKDPEKSTDAKEGATQAIKKVARASVSKAAPKRKKIVTPKKEAGEKKLLKTGVKKTVKKVAKKTATKTTGKKK